MQFETQNISQLQAFQIYEHQYMTSKGLDFHAPSAEIDPATQDCPICGSSRLERHKATASDATIITKISIVECSDCAFAWQFPWQRTHKESNEYFNEAYSTENLPDGSYFNPRRQRQVAELQLDYVQGICKKHKGSLLDIGAGSGTFARAAAARGWLVTAVDPALNIESIASVSNVSIAADIDELAPGTRFDVVVLWDVIEHVERPVELLRKAIQRLEPGGRLFVETGNFKSTERIIDGLEHWIYQLDHRWYFSPDNLGNILTSLSMIELELCPRALRPGWSGMPDYAGPSRLQLLSEMTSSPLAALPLLRRHQSLKRAAQWPGSGINIFCLTAISAACPARVNK